jgi:hypothetical protein
MLAILLVTFPFFALVLLGYLAARRGVLPAAAIGGLNAYVLYFALPCMLFRFGSGMQLAQWADPGLLLVYLACAVVMVLFTVAVTWHPGEGPKPASGVPMKDAAFGALVAAFPNSGFMGFPMLIGLLGPAAAGPLIGCLLVDIVFTSSMCLALAQLPVGRTGDAEQGAAQQGLWRALAAAMRGALSNPLPWSIALGGVMSAANLALPTPVGDIVRMLGESATPVALFTIGAVLWRSGQQAAAATPVAAYVPVALFKLLVHPLLVLSACVLARAAGVPLSRLAVLVMVLNAALPSASNVAILAERYGADNGRIARIILVSTALAFGSFSAIAWAFGVRPV